jgi:histidinol phosphatase-like enzyme (inositol monophosphatase family)
MQELIGFATELAHASGRLILDYYRQSLLGAGPAVIQKADRSPVTVADREAEALMRAMIERRYPEHQVLGEEGGTSGAADASRQWVLDPIDGTKSFVHGVPLFGTLIALLEEGRPVLGVIHLPVTGELMVGARGQGTCVNGRPVHVRTTERLEEATFAFTDCAQLHRLGLTTGFLEMQRRVRVARSWGDCYGHFLVAAGRADLMIDPELKVWDVAALKPCVEGAGGRLTELSGENPPLGTSALSSNGRLHEVALAVLNGKAGR